MAACSVAMRNKLVNMNAFKIAAFVIALNASFALAQTPANTSSKVETELKPFTAQANYMSLPGYLRHQNYLHTKEWHSIERFDYGFGGSSTRIMRSSSTITIDYGSFGQIGDFVNYMDFKALSLISRCIRIFPKLNKYSVSWSYFFSVGEGEFVSSYERAVIYDRTNGTLQGFGGVEYEKVTDEFIFGLQESQRLMEKEYKNSLTGVLLQPAKAGLVIPAG